MRYQYTVLEYLDTPGLHMREIVGAGGSSKPDASRVLCEADREMGFTPVLLCWDEEEGGGVDG